jgi:diketogulonate reductase-like aldo/keto reductase
VDRVADELGKTSTQVAISWVRQRGERMITVVGIRKLDQLLDVLGSREELSAEQLSRLDKPSEIDFGSHTTSSVRLLKARWGTATSSRRSSCRERRPIGGSRHLRVRER